jgi:hypothetical protein
LALFSGGAEDDGSADPAGSGVGDAVGKGCCLQIGTLGLGVGVAGSGVGVGLGVGGGVGSGWGGMRGSGKCGSAAAEIVSERFQSGPNGPDD